MRAQAMYDGMNADKVTYASPVPPLPSYLGLIQGTATAQQAVTQRTRGAAANRNVARDLLWTAMETERSFIQSIADANQARANSILINGGLLVISTPLHHKSLLTLKNGAASGSVECYANVGLLMSTLTDEAIAAPILQLALHAERRHELRRPSRRRPTRRRPSRGSPRRRSSACRSTLNIATGLRRMVPDGRHPRALAPPPAPAPSSSPQLPGGGSPFPLHAQRSRGAGPKLWAPSRHLTPPRASLVADAAAMPPLNVFWE